MTVDPSRPREILVVHGVQTDLDPEEEHHTLIRRLMHDRLNGLPLAFETDLFRYEGLNDHAQSCLQRVFGLVAEALLRQVPLADMLVDGASAVIDLVGDVVIALQQGAVAQEIRAQLRERILRTYRTTGAPLYLVAHSLGSVYALDVVNELIRERPDGVFERDRRKTWPVQGLITMGSPLGLELFSRGRRLEPLGRGRKWFRWFNYWCRTDPVVSGHFYGRPFDGYHLAERLRTRDPSQGWLVHDRVVDSGHAWLFAHTAYWNHPPLGDDLVTFVAS